MHGVSAAGVLPRTLDDVFWMFLVFRCFFWMVFYISINYINGQLGCHDGKAWQW